MLQPYKTNTVLYMAILLFLIPDTVAFSLAFYSSPNMLIIKVLPENDVSILLFVIK